jgi:hypothetical protein
MPRFMTATAAVILISFMPGYAGAAVTCDQASISQVESDINALSGKEKKRAMKKLEKVKQSLADKNTKKCARQLTRVMDDLKKPAQAEAAKGAGEDEPGSGDEDDEDME